MTKSYGNNLSHRAYGFDNLVVAMLLLGMRKKQLSCLVWPFFGRATLLRSRKQVQPFHIAMQWPGKARGSLALPKLLFSDSLVTPQGFDV